MPDSDTGFGEYVLDDVGVIFADLLPTAPGVNVTLTVQLLESLPGMA